MMLTLLLARYGLGDSLMCYDSKPGTLKAGQADGLQPRTLEVLKSLDIADEIINHGCHMSEVAFWNPKSSISPGQEGASSVLLSHPMLLLLRDTNTKSQSTKGASSGY